MRKYVKILLVTLLISLLCMPVFATEIPETPDSVLKPQPAETPKKADEAEKIVYLTFDDGPIPKITDQILDILKEENVPATFFIVGKEIKGREAILKRIYEEGQGIGLHTYSHNFKMIYQNPDTFISEMDKTNATINEVLGTNIQIHPIRFPGGSAGHLTQDFYDKLCAKGYLVFDWNVDLKDGIKATLSPETFLENAKKCSDHGTRRIILAHCNSNNINTCKALKLIIDYYRSEGYTFGKIDETTEPYHYHFKK